MTKKIISGLFIFLSVAHLMAQEWKDDKGVKWKLKLDECVFGMGFIYQNELLYQVGPKINIIRKH